MDPSDFLQCEDLPPKFCSNCGEELELCICEPTIEEPVEIDEPLPF